MTTATTEPTELRAGDPWAWRREDLTDYPASAWNLVYWFKNAAGGFQVAAAADGDNYVVDESSDDTQGRAAGFYSWQARVENIADNTIRHIVDSGSLTVLANLFIGTATDPYDGRSHARKVLAAIEAVLERRATKDQMSYTIEGRTLERTSIDELRRFRVAYRAEVATEDARDRLAAGTPARKLQVRF